MTFYFWSNFPIHKIHSSTDRQKIDSKKRGLQQSCRCRTLGDQVSCWSISIRQRKLAGFTANQPASKPALVCGLKKPTKMNQVCGKKSCFFTNKGTGINYRKRVLFMKYFTILTEIEHRSSTKLFNHSLNRTFGFFFPFGVMGNFFTKFTDFSAD